MCRINRHHSVSLYTRSTQTNKFHNLNLLYYISNYLSIITKFFSQPAHKMLMKAKSGTFPHTTALNCCFERYKVLFSNLRRIYSYRIALHFCRSCLACYIPKTDYVGEFCNNELQGWKKIFTNRTIFVLI